MIIYTQTPDYYDEYLQHGWLKDQAAKVHKYIERWRGKNGKWYYRYTNALNKVKSKINSKILDLKVKKNRHDLYKGHSGPFYELKTDKVLSGKGRKRWAQEVTKNYGTERTGHWDNGSANKSGNYQEGSRLKGGIEAGRERVANKKKTQKQKITQKIYNDQQSNRNRTANIKDSGAKFGKSATLSKRGYSDSKSGGNNAATKSSSVVMRSRNKNSLSNRGYHSSKSTYNSEGDSRYRMLNNRMDYLTTEEKTNYYKGRTGWRKNMTPAEQYYQLSLLNPKKYNEVASPQIKREIEDRKKKRKN